MLLPLNNSKFGRLKRLEMEKEILKQAAVLMSEIPGKLSR
ncbi:putative transposase ORF A, IS3 family [Escherichia coli]|nr:putative transposase ORF A, IS3 family [Escherichia coli]CAD5571994.1 putative transposase ORF A, IS3 family [Escherichia coli]CAD5852952.1 putative transposase ORF A, IS3 family [Escherichia coli]